jgi:hypothetical protein
VIVTLSERAYAVGAPEVGNRDDCRQRYRWGHFAVDPATSAGRDGRPFGVNVTTTAKDWLALYNVGAMARIKLGSM